MVVKDVKLTKNGGSYSPFSIEYFIALEMKPILVYSYRRFRFFLFQYPVQHKILIKLFGTEKPVLAVKAFFPAVHRNIGMHFSDLIYNHIGPVRLGIVAQNCDQVLSGNELQS
jgi:hypothetical protein